MKPATDMASTLMRFGIGSRGRYFAEALAERRRHFFASIRYACRHLAHLPNLDEVLRPIIEEDGAEPHGRVRVVNQLTMLQAVRLLNSHLGFAIEAIESRSHLVLSQRTKPTAGTTPPSCDLKDTNGSSLFVEVKDHSREETLGHLPHPLHFGAFESFISSSRRLRKWVFDQVREAKRKGADYLAMHFPFWRGSDESPEDECYSAKWLRDLFPIHRQISRHEFEVIFPKPLSTFMRGIFFVRRWGIICAKPANQVGTEVCAA